MLPRNHRWKRRPPAMTLWQLAPLLRPIRLRRPTWSRSGGPVGGRRSGGRVMIATVIVIEIVLRKAPNPPPRQTRPLKGPKASGIGVDVETATTNSANPVPTPRPRRLRRRRAHRFARRVRTRAVLPASVLRARDGTRTGTRAETRANSAAVAIKAVAATRATAADHRIGRLPPARWRVNATVRSITVLRF